MTIIPKASSLVFTSVRELRSAPYFIVLNMERISISGKSASANFVVDPHISLHIFRKGWSTSYMYCMADPKAELKNPAISPAESSRIQEDASRIMMS